MHLNAVVAEILVFLGGDHSLLVHTAQGVVLLLLAACEVEIRGHLAGISYHSCQDRCLADVQLRNVLAEVVLRRSADSVYHSAEPDLVQVALKNVDLGVFLLQAEGAEYLTEFTLPADLVIAGEVLYQLLGDGGTAAAVAVGEERSCGTVPVNALVGVESLVLRGNDCVHDVWGDVLVVHPDAVLLGSKPLYLHQLVVLIIAVDKACVLHLDVAQVRVVALVREIQHIHRQHRRHDADHDYKNQQHCGECRADYRHGVPEVPERAALLSLSGGLLYRLLLDPDVFDFLLVHTLFTCVPPFCGMGCLVTEFHMPIRMFLFIISHFTANVKPFFEIFTFLSESFLLF